MTAAQAKVPTVVQALSAVMGDVQAVGKDGRNTQQGYNFRGVDAVVNAVGPALRKHNVVVVPVAVSYEDERYQTARGAQMRGITATVTFRFYGPAGDFIEAQVAGESSDAGDKAMPKAHSVAFRTLLLEALCVPTDDPDPDEYSPDRLLPRRRSLPEGEPQAARADDPSAPVSAPGPPEAPSPSASDTAAAVQAAAARDQAAVTGNGVISDAQRRRLFAIAHTRACPEEEMRRLILEIGGVESTTLIPRSRYDAVVAAVDDWVPF